MARTKNKKADKKKDKAITLKLSYGDRINFTALYPEGTDIMTGIIFKDVKNKITLSQSEGEKLDAKRVDNRWEWQKKNDKVKSISFTKPEMKFLKDRVAELDKQKKIPPYLLEVVLKIQDIKLED